MWHEKVATQYLPLLLHETDNFVMLWDKDGDIQTIKNGLFDWQLMDKNVQLINNQL